jgi:hydroxymethylglutaryl-CoA synthase
MKTTIEVGLVGYGAYIPRYRIDNHAIARQWGKDGRKLPLAEKSMPGADEDTITMAIEAAKNALTRGGVAATALRALWVGTESKPYAVKPSSTVVAEALGATPIISAADFEFACKAGSEALQAAFAYVGSGMCEHAMAIGMDTAQSRPGDELEFTAAAGGAAMLVGRAERAIAVLERSLSYVTDTPDFFRRAHCHYPEHGRRFTGAPAYFHHSREAASRLLAELGAKPEDFRYAVFHQPTPRFPREVAKALGFACEQLAPGLVCDKIGNTYAGSSILGLAATLDVAAPGDRILCVSYGSGAGSDAFSFRVTEKILERRGAAPAVADYLERRELVGDYATYLHHTGRIYSEGI